MPSRKTQPTIELPKSIAVPLLIGLLLVVLYLDHKEKKQTVAQPPPATGQAGELLFCFWNVENLFDDREDNRNDIDRPYDLQFARSADQRTAKLNRLADILLKMNDGRGPDILAVCEVENKRAAELLQETLNARLTDPKLHYRSVQMREVAVGRHIAPALISRTDVASVRTKQYGGGKFRILESRLELNGHELIIVASHWTSRLTDKDGSNRERYADLIYGQVKAMRLSEPDVDVLICGDFNDTPEEPSVRQHLRAQGNAQAVLNSTPEDTQLLDVFTGKDPETWGTIYGRSHWSVFDHIVLSPGLLKPAGWSCDPATAAVPDSFFPANPRFRPTKNNRRQTPWAFGGDQPDGPRGFSDHFPVTVRLKVAAGADAPLP